MATLRTTHHETDAPYEVIFNRIHIDAEPVSVLVDPWFHNKTEDTSKPWVGKIDRDAGTFELVQTNATVILPIRYLEGNFFTLFIQGQVIDDGSRRRIKVQYRLAWFMALFLFLLFMFPFGLAIQFMLQEDWGKLLDLIPWVCMAVLFPAILLVVQLNRVEKEIEEMLGVSYQK